MLDLSGTIAELFLPKSNFIPPEYSIGDSPEVIKGDYHLDIENTAKKYEQNIQDSDNNEANKIVYDVQLRRIFNFCGLPLIGVDVGAVNFTLSTCYTFHNSNNNYYESFLKDLEKMHGKHATKGYLYRLYPINWSLVSLNNNYVLTYGVEDFVFHPKGISAFALEFYCPISANVSLNFRFKFDGIPLESGGISLAHELIQEIMKTYKVRYKSEHKQQVEALDLIGNFEIVKPVIWENYKKMPRVDYSVLEKYL
ncbi:hypothetical protein [Marinibactrum halimedae]|uniref:hypothetical protein n=1 Tax=Marinibactrum halimedae TaxID=1444977 RepID=UPI001E42A317|nr:hypothetical protein [Marinibactrum halimedae]MCD9460389.1 hypothetical protein [Marinibactrum halimedae]